LLSTEASAAVLAAALGSSLALALWPASAAAGGAAAAAVVSFLGSAA